VPKPRRGLALNIGVGDGRRHANVLESTIVKGTPAMDRMGLFKDRTSPAKARPLRRTNEANIATFQREISISRVKCSAELAG
jgi:hypothetical protein